MCVGVRVPCVCIFRYLLKRFIFSNSINAKDFSIIYLLICLTRAEFYEELVLDKATEKIKLRVSGDYGSGVDIQCASLVSSLCVSKHFTTYVMAFL